MPSKREPSPSDNEVMAKIVQGLGCPRHSGPFPVHAFCKLKLGSFKAFGATQELPIRPLTILFGPNSAGKSSVLHSLLYLNEMTRTRAANVRQPALGRGLIDLGGWAQAHHHNKDNGGMVFAMEFKGEAIASAKDLLGAGHTQDLGYRVSILEIPDHTNPNGAIHQCLCSFTVAGLPIVGGIGHHDGELDVDTDIVGHTIQDAWAAILKRRRKLPKDAGKLNEYGEDEAIMEAVDGICDCLQWVGAGPMERWATTYMGSSGFLKGKKDPVHFKALANSVANLSLDLAETVAEVLRSMRYHGPFRDYRRRESFIVEPAMGYSGFAGDDAWDTLLRRGDVRAKVNAWMHSCDTLETGYEVVHRRFVDTATLFDVLLKAFDQSPEIDHPSGDAWWKDSRIYEAGQSNLVEDPAVVETARKAFLFLESIHVLAPARIPAPTHDLALALTLELMDKMPFRTLDQLLLVERRTGKEVSLKDIGVGLSQLLPLLVSAFAANNELVLVEQPELHIHPALQADLGDVFLDSALGAQQNTFILETHSEHLLLRILRRIRETSAGNLAEGLIPVHPDDVSVLFLEKGSDGTLVTQIPLTAEGDFAIPWPHGFFPERAQELF